MKIEKLLVNDKITALCQTNIPSKHYFKCNKQQKMNFEKFRLTSFSKPQVHSVSIFFKFVHPCLLLYLLNYFYLLLCFEQFISCITKFALVPVFTVWILWISWHSSFNNNKFLDLFFLLRDGPLEKLWGGGERNFRATGIFFGYQVPCMNLF